MFISGDTVINELRGPSFPFHCAEQTVQVLYFKIYIAAIAFQQMIFGKCIYQLFKKIDTLKIRNGIKCCLFKQAKVILDHIIAKSVICIDVNFICISANKLKN